MAEQSRAYALGGLGLGSLLGRGVSAYAGAAASAATLLAAATTAGTALALLLRQLGRRVLAVPLALLGAGMMPAGPLVLPSRPAGWVYAGCGLLVLAGAVLMLK